LDYLIKIKILFQCYTYVYKFLIQFKGVYSKDYWSVCLDWCGGEKKREKRERE